MLNKFYAGSVSPYKMAHVVALLDFSTSDIPLTYLGCPILKNAPKTSHFQAIGDKIKLKLDI